VAVVEHSDCRQQRFRFVHQRDDYDRLVSFFRAGPSPCRIALQPTADYHRTVAYRLVSEGFDLVLVSSVAGARLNHERDVSLEYHISSQQSI
jgi:transposase